MGELGVVRKYYYWSDRKVREIATNCDIPLNTRWAWSLKTPSVPYIGQVEVRQQQRNLRRNEVADKIETAIGRRAVEDLVSPPPVGFAKGVGHIEFARLPETRAANDGAVMHIQTRNSLGVRVDVCLFGSMDNFWGRIQRADYNPEGWASSAWYAIEELLASHGQENTSQWDDEESRAVEALKIALGQGVTTYVSEHRDRPWTRGFTIGSAEDTEWFADIYVDVELTKDRWDFSPAEPEYGAERILIGAPAWIRTASSAPVTFYHADTDRARRRRARN